MQFLSKLIEIQLFSTSLLDFSRFLYFVTLFVKLPLYLATKKNGEKNNWCDQSIMWKIRSILSILRWRPLTTPQRSTKQIFRIGIWHNWWDHVFCEEIKQQICSNCERRWALKSIDRCSFVDWWFFCRCPKMTRENRWNCPTHTCIWLVFHCRHIWI